MFSFLQCESYIKQIHLNRGLVIFLEKTHPQPLKNREQSGNMPSSNVQTSALNGKWQWSLVNHEETEPGQSSSLCFRLCYKLPTERENINTIPAGARVKRKCHAVGRSLPGCIIAKAFKQLYCVTSLVTVSFLYSCLSYTDFVVFFVF